MKKRAWALAVGIAIVAVAARTEADDKAPASFEPGSLSAAIAKTCQVTEVGSFHGYRQTKFKFRDHNAWVVEPKGKVAAGRPWTWTMQWATAFVPRTPVLHLLGEGWHHVTIDVFSHHMDEKGIEICKAYQEFLVKELGFAPKASLVGMSWGGFFSVRYANACPQNVSAIYLDCPLLCFDRFQDCALGSNPKCTNWVRPAACANWADDPRMPVNMGEALAKANLPIYLLYGGVDRVCPPEHNCEPFIKRFQAAGGKATIDRRAAYGHHPHGLEASDRRLADFFVEARAKQAGVQQHVSP